MATFSKSCCLNVTLCLVFVCLVLVPGELEARLGGTARDYFTPAENAALNWSPGAELLYLAGGGDDMHVAGEALVWTYFFESTSEDSIYMVVVSLGIIALEQAVTDTFSILQPLPSNWIDSDDAVWVAEDNGGSNFRASTGSDIIVAGAGIGLYVQELERPVWLVTYMDTTSVTSMLFVYVDAVTGEWINTQGLGVGDGGAAGPAPPKAFTLSQNYPNPFNPSTSLTFTVPTGASADVRLEVFDVRGRRRRTLFKGEKKPGTYEIHWDGRNQEGAAVESGTYLARLTAGQDRIVRKMILLK